MPTEPTEQADSRDTLLYEVARIRAIERTALALVPPGTLMQRAGAATASLALSLLEQHEGAVLIIAGPGNNGGDAMETATLLHGVGRRVSVVLLGDPARLPSDAAAAMHKARGSGVRFIELADTDEHWALAIDGLFGIGLARPPEGEYREAVERMNRLPCPVISIDVPSGLDADNGTLVGGANAVAVRADYTITFIANKPGLHTAHGRDYAGQVHVNTLDIDPALLSGARAKLSTPAQFSQNFTQRPHASHKGSYGDLTVIGGSAGMGGAVLLAARMGALAGAGRVFAAFAAPAPAFDPLHPELMCRDAHAVALDSGAAVIGPGLGMSRDAADLTARALACRLPLVVDADALNLIAAEPGLQQRVSQRHAPSLLTPHPLEAARLLGISAAEVQAGRLDAAAELARRLQAHVILKGSGTVIASPEGELVINSTGNPALATAGSGDVLAGLCGALLARQMPAHEAAIAAAWLHGQAADRMVADGIGPVGITASELPLFIRSELNALQRRPGRHA